jgi:hypothetical protein
MKLADKKEWEIYKTAIQDLQTSWTKGGITIENHKQE